MGFSSKTGSLCLAPQYAGGRKLDKPGAAPASREGTLTAIAGYRIANIKPDIASDAAARVWARDSSFWGPGDDDPADRLGWLESPDEMSDAAPDLVRFAESAAGTDFSAVALLGMGGSALASEVFARTVPGRGTQFVLCDSTHPSEVQRAAAALDLDHTLFVVSSKSGTTVETISLYRYFRALTDDGSKFVAITDPGTPLEDLARRDRFLATFTNRPDIGGRFSALSYFGLVPAALVGVDIAALIAGARTMAERCSASTLAGENPGVVLGSALGLLANGGRDKLTLVTPPRLRALGGWIEQLVAESTGKRGTGIVPVVDEPPAEPKDYGNDRAFVHIRLDGDDTHEDHVDQLIGAGHPVIGIDVDDVLDLAAEMFRWEFAVVVASAILGINAFDQPDVEAAKSSARTALQSADMIDWPDEDPGGLFEDIAPPELAALLLFTPASEAATSVLDAARRKLLSGGRGVATSAGFGPRYLHSTGQLHKGGPKGVRALVVLDPPTDDVAVPGTDYGFARLVTAQALGDARALESAGRRAACTSFESFRRWAES
jgi:transaldolase / glucose-6-phosphate isomerase